MTKIEGNKKMFNYKVKVHPIKNPKSKLRAYASLVVENKMEITGFKVFESANGLFAKEPQHKGKNKEGEDTWYDDVRFLKDEGEETNTFRNEIMEAIVSAYNANSNSNQQASRTSAAQAQSQVNQNTNTAGFPW